MPKRRSKTGKEIHHVVPRCEGGPDDPSNLIPLTELEHAEVHAWDFINGGPWFDYRLSGASSLPLEVQYLVKEEMRRRTTEWNLQMIADGVHPSFSTENKESMAARQRERFLSLNGLDAEWENKRLGALRRKHAEERCCPHCGTAGKGTAMAKWHFDNCPEFTGEIRRQRTLTCPHCGLTGGYANLKRYHFDNCKHKQ